MSKRTSKERAGSNRSGRRRGPILIGICLVALLIAGALGELGARLLFGDSTNLFPRYHTKAQYGDYELRRIRPDTVFWHTSADGRWKFETNARGFRNREDFNYKKPAGVVRVLCLGDSQTQGYECNQDATYAAVIDRYLEREGFQTQTINAGVSGFSTAEVVAFLENEGIRYEPDVVVYGFFANDPSDNLRCGLFELNDGELVAAKKSHLPGVAIQDFIYSFPPIRFLSENSYLYSKLFNTVWNFYKMRSVKNSRDEAGLEYAVQTEAVSSVESELTNALMRRLGAFLDEQGIPLIVMDLPSPDLKSDDRTAFFPSVPEPVSPVAAEVADYYLTSEAALGDYRGLTTFHVAHGQRHMSEFSHLMMGRNAARWIADALADQ